MEQKEKVQKYLEQIQEQFLIERFGRNYLEQINLFKAISVSEQFTKYMFSQIDEPNFDFNAYWIEIQKRIESTSIISTKYDLWYNMSILKRQFDLIEYSAKKLSYYTSSIPFIGTAFSIDFNAFAVKEPDTNANIIICESEIFQLADILSKLISNCFLRISRVENDIQFHLDKNSVIKSIDNNKWIVDKFVQLLNYNNFKGSISSINNFFISNELIRFSDNLRNSIELFIVGHEYGHIAANHLNIALVIEKNIHGLKIKRIKPEWEMEYEADKLGLDLMLYSVFNTPNHLRPICMLGPYVLFSFLDVFERNKHGDISFYEESSHPPAFERKKYIKSIIQNSFSIDGLDLLFQFIDFSFELLYKKSAKL